MLAMRANERRDQVLSWQVAAGRENQTGSNRGTVPEVVGNGFAPISLAVLLTSAGLSLNR